MGKYYRPVKVGRGVPRAGEVRIYRVDPAFVEAFAKDLADGVEPEPPAKVRPALTFGQRRNLETTGHPNIRPGFKRKARAKVLKRDGYRCRYCGTDKGPFQIDHVRPYSKGGGESLDNLVTACARCNAAKSNKPGMVPLPIPSAAKVRRQGA